MYSKFKEIESVMSAAAARLHSIDREYQNALHARTVSDQLLIEIKAYFGDLRSALDYLNHKIAGSDRYFPICAHQNDFVARYSKVSAATSAVLAKWQPYNGNDWLKWFNVLNNKNKHVTLVPQIRREFVETRVSAPGGSVSWGPGVTFGSGVSVMGIPIDPRTQLPIPNNIVKTERITWVDFHFDTSVSPTELPSGLSALPFLKDVVTKVSAVIKEVEQTLS